MSTACRSTLRFLCLSASASKVAEIPISLPVWISGRSDNGLAFLNSHINSFMSLKTVSYVDLDTHGMFICEITEARVMSDRETMTYTYYQKNVKPKPRPRAFPAMSARCADMYMRAKLCLMILSVRFVSTARPILKK